MPAHTNAGRGEIDRAVVITALANGVGDDRVGLGQRVVLVHENVAAIVESGECQFHAVFVVAHCCRFEVAFEDCLVGNVEIGILLRLVNRLNLLILDGIFNE